MRFEIQKAARLGRVGAVVRMVSGLLALAFPDRRNGSPVRGGVDSARRGRHDARLPRGSERALANRGMLGLSELV